MREQTWHICVDKGSLSKRLDELRKILRSTERYTLDKKTHFKKGTDASRALLSLQATHRTCDDSRFVWYGKKEELAKYYHRWFS